MNLGILKFKIKYYLARIFLYLFVLPKNSHGAEIGVRKGGNAKLLYYLTAPKELCLVDNYNETNLYSKQESNLMHDSVLLWACCKDVFLYRETSKKCSQRILWNLDWIYIDSDHMDLYNDLTYWYDNVKTGGIFMGDDYGTAYPQVKKDLNKFCKEKNIKLKTLHYQWWFRK